MFLVTWDLNRDPSVPDKAHVKPLLTLKTLKFCWRPRHPSEPSKGILQSTLLNLKDLSDHLDQF